jgi:hypothetical protein
VHGAGPRGQHGRVVRIGWCWRLRFNVECGKAGGVCVQSNGNVNHASGWSQPFSTV